MNDWLLVVLLTFTPGLELRASIPVGIASGLPWLGVLIVAVIANIIVGVIVWMLLDVIFSLMHKISWLGRLWDRYVERTASQVEDENRLVGLLVHAISE